MALTLSIVTPTYNQGKYISQTIESILSQEGNFYIDYIIINDGSTDNTISIIEKYDVLLKKNLWPIKCKGITLRYWTRENGGQTSAINEGLKVAKGYACAWMNSDDYYLPGAFSVISETFEQNQDIDFVYTDCLKIYEDGRPSTIEPRPRPNETFESLRSRGNSFSLNFFTKRILNKTGYLDESLQYCVDLEQWLRILKVAKVKYIPYVAGCYRYWPGSKTATQQSKFAEERKLILKKYGGNVIPPKKIYALRKRMRFLNHLQTRTPRLYSALKQAFYRLVDAFKYKNDGKK